MENPVWISLFSLISLQPLMIALSSSFSGKPRQASMAAYRQLLAENHVEEILQDVKQNGRKF